MAKIEPENIADLQRMIETSNGWFDGLLKSRKLIAEGEENEVGKATREETKVRVGWLGDTMSVVCCRWVTSELHSRSSYSSTCEEVWEKPMTFEEFKSSEWWELAMEKFKGGSCDASEIFARHDDEEEEGDGPKSYASITAQCEKRYRDWLNNNRLDKGYNTVRFWVYGNGDAGFSFNGKNYEFDVSELAGIIEKVRAFDEAGVELRDGELVVKVGKEDGDDR